MIKLRAVVKELKSVELSDADAQNLVLGWLYKVWGAPRGAYLGEGRYQGKLVIDEEYHTSHSWFETKVLRDAEPRDSLFLEVLREVRQIEIDVSGLSDPYAK